MFSAVAAGLWLIAVIRIIPDKWNDGVEWAESVSSIGIFVWLEYLINR
jgi:hypothetical protein